MDGWHRNLVLRSSGGLWIFWGVVGKKTIGGIALSSNLEFLLI